MVVHGTTLAGDYAITWTLTIIVGITVALRFFTRFKVKPAAGWDDVIIALSMVCPSRTHYVEASL